MKSIYLSVIFFGLLSCFAPKKTVAPLGYFSLNPYAKPQLKKIDKTLNIFLTDEVKDIVVLDQYKFGKLTVTEFRKSVSDGLTKAFQKNFINVKIVNEVQQNEPTLVIYRLNPFWTMGNAANPNAMSATFQYESSIILNGQKISNADGKAYSDLKVNIMDANQPKEVFKDGLKLTLESIEKGVMTDDSVQKLNDK